MSARKLVSLSLKCDPSHVYYTETSYRSESGSAKKSPLVASHFRQADTQKHGKKIRVFPVPVEKF